MVFGGRRQTSGKIEEIALHVERTLFSERLKTAMG